VVEKLETFDSNILKHVEKDSSSSDEGDAFKEAYIQEKTHQKVRISAIIGLIRNS
jgi:hypothetical protein